MEEQKKIISNNPEKSNVEESKGAKENLQAPVLQKASADSSGAADVRIRKIREDFPELEMKPQSGLRKKIIIRRVIISIIILTIIVLAAIGMYFFFLKNISKDNNNTTDTNSGINIEKSIIFGVAGSSSSIANVSSVLVTINNLQIHTDEKDWITISEETKQFDLLSLSQKRITSMIASKLDVENGLYNQVKMNLSKVVIVENGVEKEAIIPSKDLKVFANIVVSKDMQSTVLFDFSVDQSLYIMGADQFIFTPSVKVETRSNSHDTVNLNNEITKSGGQVDTMTSVGMYINGEIKTGFVFDGNTKFDMVGNVIKITVEGENDKLIKITPDLAINLAINESYLDAAISIELVTKNGKKAWVVSGLKNLELKNVYIDAGTGFIISVISAEYESCLYDVNFTVGNSNSCNLDSDCVGIPIVCGMESINSKFNYEFNNKIKEIKSRCPMVFDSLCSPLESNNFNYKCNNNKCIAISKPVYETTVGDIKFTLESSVDLGSVLKSTKTYQKDLTTTGRFIKVIIGAQNKGKNETLQFAWEIVNIIDSDGRNFTPITNKAYSFLPQPDLCGAMLKPELAPVPCVRLYEVSKQSTGLKIEVVSESPKIGKSLLDLILP